MSNTLVFVLHKTCRKLSVQFSEAQPPKIDPLPDPSQTSSHLVRRSSTSIPAGPVVEKRLGSLAHHLSKLPSSVLTACGLPEVATAYSLFAPPGISSWPLLKAPYPTSSARVGFVYILPPRRETAIPPWSVPSPGNSQPPIPSLIPRPPCLVLDRIWPLALPNWPPVLSCTYKSTLFGALAAIVSYWSEPPRPVSQLRFLGQPTSTLPGASHCISQKKFSASCLLSISMVNPDWSHHP